jgi:hypothetical protein
MNRSISPREIFEELKDEALANVALYPARERAERNEKIIKICDSIRNKVIQESKNGRLLCIVPSLYRYPEVIEELEKAGFCLVETYNEEGLNAHLISWADQQEQK